VAVFQHLLLAIDGTELAEKALAYGFALAKQLKARVTIVTVTKPWPAAPYGTMPTPSLIDIYAKTSAENAANILSSATTTAEKAGVACATLHIKDQYPADGIIAAAMDHACDLIVMASHGRGALGRLLLGGEALKVVTLSPVPVLICR
jgi:nucleotide-binding universal stress UspA family protein